MVIVVTVVTVVTVVVIMLDEILVDTHSFMKNTNTPTTVEFMMTFLVECSIGP